MRGLVNQRAILAIGGVLMATLVMIVATQSVLGFFGIMQGQGTVDYLDDIEERVSNKCQAAESASDDTVEIVMEDVKLKALEKLEVIGDDSKKLKADLEDGDSWTSQEFVDCEVSLDDTVESGGTWKFTIYFPNDPPPAKVNIDPEKVS